MIGGIFSAMLAFTLDTNCLVALEEGRPEAKGVRALLARQSAGAAMVRLVATTASERQTDGTYLPNLDLFRERLKASGLDHLELLRPVAIWDLVYWDWAVRGSDETDAELRAIHRTLFPQAPYDLPAAAPESLGEDEYKRVEHKWRNRRLDVLGLHTHIRVGGDVFVTSDRNFSKESKAPALATLGAPLILTPDEAEAYAAEQG